MIVVNGYGYKSQRGTLKGKSAKLVRTVQSETVYVRRQVVPLVLRYTGHACFTVYRLENGDPKSLAPCLREQMKVCMGTIFHPLSCDWLVPSTDFLLVSIFSTFKRVLLNTLLVGLFCLALVRVHLTDQSTILLARTK